MLHTLVIHLIDISKDSINTFQSICCPDSTRYNLHSLEYLAETGYRPHTAKKRMWFLTSFQLLPTLTHYIHNACVIIEIFFLVFSALIRQWQWKQSFDNTLILETIFFNQYTQKRCHDILTSTEKILLLRVWPLKQKLLLGHLFQQFTDEFT